MNDINKREYIALQILNGACAGDWKFEIPEGLKWENVATSRAFEIADAFLAASQNNLTVLPKPVKKAKSEKI